MLVYSVLLLAGIVLLTILHGQLVLKPKRLRSVLREQGISGPPPTLLLGNLRQIKKARSHVPIVEAQTGEPPISHDVASVIFPFFDEWMKQYGQLFVFSLGNTQILCVNQPDVVREITTCTSLDLGKPSYQQTERGPLLGRGILTSNGAAWAHQRKILAPELYMDKVKGMTGLIIESAAKLLNSWKSEIEIKGEPAEIEIDEYMRSFSGDVISRACFGSSYSSGEEIFQKLRALQQTMSKKSLFIGIPGMRYLPTKSNREAWSLEKEVRNLILRVVKEREEAAHEKDLLQMVLEGAKSTELSQEATDNFIVDNCKSIYLAGYETTSVSATWCLMLLALNQDWQARVREEVLQITMGGIPETDMLRKMKQLNMVIHESLRLYPPVTVVSREVFKDMKFGGVNVPKGFNIWTMALSLHTDPEIWGADAYTFRPDRFEKGIAGACKFPHLYMPFGAGPRVCLGQNLAMVELKLLVALIVSNFAFSLSPSYRHSPALRLVIEPEHGVHLLVKKL